MKKNWRTIDKMALDAMSFILDYCDRNDLCDDCIFSDYDDDDNCCQLRKPLHEIEEFIEERKHE